MRRGGILAVLALLAAFGTAPYTQAAPDAEPADTDSACGGATTLDGVLDQYKLSPAAKSDIARTINRKIGKGGFAALPPRRREQACAGIETFVDDLYARQHPHHHFGWHHSHNAKGPTDTEVKAALHNRFFCPLWPIC